MKFHEFLVYMSENYSGKANNEDHPARVAELLKNHPNFNLSIGGMFVWGETKDGHLFWQKVFNEDDMLLSKEYQQWISENKPIPFDPTSISKMRKLCS